MIGLWLIGMLVYALALPGTTLGGVTLGAHSLLAASLAMLLGFQLIQFAMFAKTFAISQRLIPTDQSFARLLNFLNLERCLVFGTAAFLTGGWLLLCAVNRWRAVHYGDLDYAITMPSYASKYMPGQGLILAVGQFAGGHPIVGAWLSAGFAAAAICWMLQGWMPPKWALIGGLLFALHAVLLVRWANSYWGGFLPMTGGALMFGAVQRIMRATKWTDSVILALGAVILMFTRPFEGAVVGCCISSWLVGWMLFGNRPVWTRVLTRLVLPSALVLGLGLAVLGFYNMKVTGSPSQLPYQIHEQTYANGPLFLWESPSETIEYRHDAMRDFWTGPAFQDYKQQQTIAGWIQSKASSIYEVGNLFLGPSLWILLLPFWPLVRRRRLRMVWVTLVVFLGAQLTVPWMYPHYFAPAAPLLFLLIAQAMRHWRGWTRQGFVFGKWMLPVVASLHLIVLPVIAIDHASNDLSDWQWNRARIQKQLESTAGDHLVIVRYDDHHHGHHEWVFNRADIDGAKVVWAREMDDGRNRELINYFDDRKVWLLDADEPDPNPTPVRNLDSIAAHR